MDVLINISDDSGVPVKNKFTYNPVQNNNISMASDLGFESEIEYVIGMVQEFREDMLKKLEELGYLLKRENI